MNKKLLALAIAGALAPLAVPMTAMADVAIGGTMHVSADSLNGGGVVAGKGNGKGTYISSNSSNIMISGSTDIGDGMKALFMSQTYLSLGSDSNPPVGNPAGFVYDQFSNANTYAGLSGDLGMAAFGRNDSPMKQLGRAVDLFSSEMGDSRSITNAPSYAGAPTSYGFDERPGHTVFYVSPAFAGVTVKAAYTMENSVVTTATGGLSGTSAQIPAGKGHETSVSAVFNQGPVIAGLAYENHNSSMYGATHAENALRLAGSFNFSPVRVAVLVQHDDDLSGVSGASRNVFGVGVAYSFIPDYAVKAQYYNAGSVNNVPNSNGKLFAVGLTHNLSKQASVYLDYSKATNSSAASYSAFGGGHGNNPGPAPGKNPSGASMGMIYSF